MKKLYILLVSVFISLGAVAGNAQLFEFDEAAVQHELAQLTELEQRIAANPGMDFSDLKDSGGQEIKGFAQLMHPDPGDLIAWCLVDCCFHIGIELAINALISGSPEERRVAWIVVGLLAVATVATIVIYNAQYWYY